MSASASPGLSGLWAPALQVEDGGGRVTDTCTARDTGLRLCWHSRPAPCDCLRHHAGRLESWALPPFCLLSSLGLWAQLLQLGVRIAGTTSTVHLVCLLCVFQSTHLYMYRCVELFSIMVCWTEETLLSYGNFTGYTLKGWDKRSATGCRDADITCLFNRFGGF